MKKLLLGLLLLTAPAWASDVVIFDVATGRAIAYLMSVNTPSFIGRPDVIFNPVLPPGIPLKFLLFTTNAEITVMNAAQSNAVLIAEAALADSELRTSARHPVTMLTSQGLVLRAFADTARDEINLLRLELSIAKTNLALFQSRPTMAPRTLAQLQTSITNKVNSGSVD